MALDIAGGGRGAGVEPRPAAVARRGQRARGRALQGCGARPRRLRLGLLRLVAAGGWLLAFQRRHRHDHVPRYAVSLGSFDHFSRVVQKEFRFCILEGFLSKSFLFLTLIHVPTSILYNFKKIIFFHQLTYGLSPLTGAEPTLS